MKQNPLTGEYDDIETGMDEPNPIDEDENIYDESGLVIGRSSRKMAEDRPMRDI